MAGHRINFSDGSVAYMDYADAEGRAVVNGRVWRWEFHEYCGPLFLRADGEPRKNQCPTVKAVWDAFSIWHKAYESAKSMTAKTTSPDELGAASCSASLDVADCCISLDEARDVIRRRERYADGLVVWMNERRNFTTLGMIQERLRPLCSKPNDTTDPRHEK